MYSVLLATAMSLTPTTPEFGGLFRRQSETGCYGASSCYGCGGGNGGIFGFRSRYRDGGCHGSGYGACYGSSGGCVGSYSMPMQSFAAPVAVAAPAGDCCGGFGTYGGVATAQPYPPPGVYEATGPATGGTSPFPGQFPGMGPMTGETSPPPIAGAPGAAMTSPDRATIVVTMPGDGLLYAEGHKIDGVGQVRVFQTPALDPAKEYEYELLMTVMRRGKEEKVTKKTEKFRAGARVRVEFGEPGTGASARFHLRMPPGGQLTVEGTPVAVAGSVFQTPPLSADRTYHYSLKLTVPGDGRPTTLTRDVTFRAGQDVRVDFLTPVDRMASGR